jgi:plastocyanin
VPNDLIKDPSVADTCGKANPGPVFTTFYVVGPNKGLKDVVVYLAGVTGKSTGDSAPTIILDQKNCQYTPYIFAVQTGQKITIRNSDAWNHNVHIVPGAPGNDEQNKLQAGGDPDMVVSFQKPEDFLTFKCDIHAWMRSYVTVVDNPWFAVTGADGSYKLSNVPPGKYTVQARHRKASGGKPVTKDIEVKDGTATLDFVLDAPQ